MKTKVLITTEGGVVTSISANTEDIHVIVIDYDKNADYENDVSISGLFTPGFIADKIYKIFEDPDTKQEEYIYNDLKEKDF